MGQERAAGKANKENGQDGRGNSNNSSSSNPYRVRLPTAFVATTLLGAALLAFGGGRFAARQQHLHVQPHQEAKGAFASSSATAADAQSSTTNRELSSSIIDPVATHVVTPSAEQGDDGDKAEEETADGAGYDRTFQYLIDIYPVSQDFVESKDQLLRALMELVRVLDVGPVLSHHCHRHSSGGGRGTAATATGLYCVALLQELGHVSFLTWPAVRTVSLDIFAEDAESEPEDVLASVEQLFAVSADGGSKDENASSSSSSNGKPVVKWVAKKRGFRVLEKGGENLEDFDIDFFVLGKRSLDIKQFVAEEHTEFQTISIFDIVDQKIRPGLAEYQKSIQKDDSYHSRHPELFRPGRVIYLDGIMQSRLFGEAAYHEALVHPALLSHPNPKRVAIIGGGEGATLREVLKHKTVEHVAMIDIDKIMVEVCKEYLPEWNSCGNLVGSAPSCFDDPRAEVYFEDAVAWFLKRFRDEDEIDPGQRYDVIIMDALDPNSETPFSDYLYSNTDFTISLSSSLNTNGVLVAQVGESDDSEEVGDHLVKKTGLATFQAHLQQYGFKTVDFYEESHGGFLASWCYLIAFKDVEGRKKFDSNQATIDFKLQWRAMDTVDGLTPFRFFDGATMMGYQFPTRLSQDAQCLNLPTPAFCSAEGGFDPERPHAPSRVLNVSQTNGTAFGDQAVVIAQEEIPKNSLLAVDDGGRDMIFAAQTVALVEAFSKARFANSKLDPLIAYMHKYGHRLAGDYSGEYLVATSAISMLILNGLKEVELPQKTWVSIAFRRNVRALKKAVWTSDVVKAGEPILSENLAGHLLSK